MRGVLILITLITLTIISAEEVSSPVVELPLGTIEGSIQESLSGRNYYSFEGVPYARPPVGKYRFKEPVASKPWLGVLQAKTMYRCLQYFQYSLPNEDRVFGDEDCLYLNIYTPTLDQKANLDVIIYIHGGAFMFNYGGYQGPQYLLDHEVVYINLNYRLGPLGFLSTENDIVPGNNGLKDQIAALKWVKENVKYFGGNPDSITISGMSAGGASVHAHYLSPKSKGLFHKGLSLSGTMLNPWVLTEKPLEKAKKLGAIVGCPDNGIDKLVHCLRTRPGRQIVAAVKEFQPWMYNPFTPFGVVTDYTWSADPVFPDHPYNLLKSGRFNDLPWVVSHTNSEGLYPGIDFYANEEDLKEIDTRWNDLIPYILDFNNTIQDPKLLEEVSQKIRDHYMKDKPICKSTFLNFIDALSDRIFLIDIWKSALLQVALAKSDIYFYHFTYRGAHSLSEGRLGIPDNLRACHGDDITYVFKTEIDTSSTNRDRLMIKRLVEMFTSFAKTGKPDLGVEWLPLAKQNEYGLDGLNINGPNNIFQERIPFNNREFWDSLPLHENEKLFSNVKEEL